MPFVRRIVSSPVESTLSVVKRTVNLYVPKKKPGDVDVPIDEIPDASLQDLAIQYPREFAKHAEARGLDLELPPTDDELLDDDDDDEDDEPTWTPRQAAFLAASAADAAKMVEAAKDDVELLAEYSEAESAQPKARKSVLTALSKALAED